MAVPCAEKGSQQHQWSRGFAEAVSAILSAPDEELDCQGAKLALDKLLDPTIDVVAVAAELEEMAERACGLAGPGADEEARLGALRTLLYQPGSWNDHRPFEYNHDDPFDADAPLISGYLKTRRGNCLAMPVLFLILGEKLGLDLALSTAPGHLFLHYRDPRGRIINLEPTSGGHPARSEWIRELTPMSDRALESGLYMRTLSRREGVALLAVTVLNHLLGQEDYEQVIAIAEVVLSHYPNEVMAMLAQASACAHLLRVEFLEKYSRPYLIPKPLQPRYLMLSRRNDGLFNALETLGWEPEEGAMSYVEPRILPLPPPDLGCFRAQFTFQPVSERMSHVS